MITLAAAKLGRLRAFVAHSPASTACHIDRVVWAAGQHRRAARDIILQARRAEDRRLTGL
jgi:hypothetical protein